MRFASFRRKDKKGWLCFCIVKTWRPVYTRMNAWFAKEAQLAQWVIVDEDSFCNRLKEVVAHATDAR